MNSYDQDADNHKKKMIMLLLDQNVPAKIIAEVLRWYQ